MGLASVIGSLRVIFGADTAAFERGATEVERRANRIERQFRALGDRFTTLGRQMTVGLTVPLAAFGVAAARAASDAAELQSAFNVTFGDLADGMNRWAEATGNAMGRSTQEIQRGANAFGLYFNQAADTRQEAARLSQQFTVLAQDLASFHNTGVDEALLALRSGLSGETEPMRRFGVFLNEAAVSAKALEMGLVPVNGRLTDQQKIMARAAIIMEATSAAQGDVIRTNDSAANTVRRLTGAWEEFKVKIGDKLLPRITPIVEGLNRLMERFSNLSPAVQQTIVNIGVFAAALGPVIIGIGAVINALAPIMSVLAAVSGAASGAGVAFAGLGAALGPVLAIVAAIAALGAVLYVNWQRIAPVVQDFGEKLSAAVGPHVQQMLSDLKALGTELWTGPFGDLLRAANDKLFEFYQTYMRTVGPPLIAGLGNLARVVSGSFGVVINTLRIVSRLLDGDFAGAWRAAGDAAMSANNLFLGLPARISRAMELLVSGVRNWLVGQLGRVWDSVAERIEQVRAMFFGLYDAVVGHSYIPDMVDGIASHMARLQAVMVEPARSATEQAAEEFRQLTALMDELFPEAARRNAFAAELAVLNNGLRTGRIEAEQFAAAVTRLRQKYSDLPRNGIFGIVPDIAGPDMASVVPDAQATTRQLAEVMGITADGIEAQNVRIVESFAQMAQGALSELDRLVKGIRSGNIVDILSGVLGALDKIGGIFGGFKIGPFSFGGAKAIGGTVNPNRAYLVGERGPELFVPPSMGTIKTNDASAGRTNVQVVPSPLFDVVINGRVQGGVARAAPGLVMAGSQGAQASIARRGMRRLA